MLFSQQLSEKWKVSVKHSRLRICFQLSLKLKYVTSVWAFMKMVQLTSKYLGQMNTPTNFMYVVIQLVQNKFLYWYSPETLWSGDLICPVWWLFILSWTTCIKWKFYYCKKWSHFHQATIHKCYSQEESSQSVGRLLREFLFKCLVDISYKTPWVLVVLLFQVISNNLMLWHYSILLGYIPSLIACLCIWSFKWLGLDFIF